MQTAQPLAGLFRVERAKPVESAAPTVTQVTEVTPVALSAPSVLTAPSGLRAKAAANLAAVALLRELEEADRPATPAEREVLGAWSAWGALPKVFDDADTDWADTRATLQGLLTESEWDAARRTTINAHYTPPWLAQAMWDAAGAFGFAGGTVLEPGCGAGAFLGTAPAGAECFGIEVDPVSATIARLLYPDASVRCEGFETSRFPDGWFDLAIGNVPFGDITFYDPRHNRGRHSIHNHFAIKALHLVRPGGLVALITSRYALDSLSDKHRVEMARLAELAGVIRLPAGAMRATAGTEVVVDVLFLRRRDGIGGPEWQRAVPVDTADGQVVINEYFAGRPELLLGTLGSQRGMYRADELVVRADGRDLDAAFREATARLAGEQPPGSGPAESMVAPPCPAEESSLFSIGGAPMSIELEDQAVVVKATRQVRRARRAGALTPRPPTPAEGFDPALHQEGTILRTADRGLCQLVDGLLVAFEPTSAKDEPELVALLDLRDTVLSVLDAQADSFDDDAFAAAQTELNARYDAYVARFGALNRFSLSPSGHLDDEGEKKMRKLRPRMGGFGDDPAFHTVMALEHFDPDDQSATKADIFSRRVVGPRPRRDQATSAQDALGICLDELGRVDLDRIAALLSVDAEEARSLLGPLVYDDPLGGLATAAEYLSGNVRRKLEQARHAAGADARWQPNVDALAAVMPADLGPDDIDCRLGSPWLETADIEEFVTVTFIDEGRRTRWSRVTVDHARINSTWEVTVDNWARHSLDMTSTWGTPRADAVTLIQASLNQTPAAVYDTIERPDGGKSRVINHDETFLAREKQVAIEARFRTWVWENPQRSERLVTLYNRLFNSTVLPTYDGSHLSLPGLNLNFSPHPHQRDAVWRIIASPAVLLAHAVGAGKTMACAAGGMEMRRLGLVNKPAYVVPNHMLEQYASEMLQLYPMAKILVPTAKETTPGGRKNFVARCAMGDWDAVILTHDAFKVIPVTPTTTLRFLERMAAAFREAADEGRAAGASRMSIKNLEAACVRLEQKRLALLDAEGKDDGVNFEATGIDYLFVDESQAFKSLSFPTHMRSLSKKPSQRAADLELKLQYLRERRGDRVVTFATATPIANSIAEMYVVQKYLQPDRLAEAGVANFDAWAATFGETVTNLELAPDGGSYRMNSRFAKFHNVPELVTMFREVADVMTPAELKLPVPEVQGGKPAAVIVSASPGLTTYVKGLVERARKVRNREVTPQEDNILKVCNDGRKAALDLRLVGLRPDPAGGKIAACAARVAEIHHSHAERLYLPSSRRGVFQIVFCDLGTPRDTWNAYDQLRTDLVERGVPTSMIRYVHEADDPKAKEALFAACRAGQVAVLVGSTGKMGVGTNVQTRLAALHHLDCPWRPDEVEQREGRGLRQGNHNPTVVINRYATEGSFDVFMWQTVERKANFIHQVMRGDVVAREVEDVSEAALSFAEIKALATGNPLIMEKAGVDNDVARLLRLRHAHAADQRRVDRRIADGEDRAARTEGRIALLTHALTVRQVPDPFTMTVGEETFTERKAAGEAFRLRLDALLDGPPLDITYPVGTYAGFELTASCHRGFINKEVILAVEGTPERWAFAGKDLDRMDAVGITLQLQHAIIKLDVDLDEARRLLDDTTTDIAAAEQRRSPAFDQEPLLESLQRKQADLAEQLAHLEEKEQAA